MFVFLKYSNIIRPPLFRIFEKNYNKIKCKLSKMDYASIESTEQLYYKIKDRRTLKKLLSVNGL